MKKIKIPIIIGLLIFPFICFKLKEITNQNNLEIKVINLKINSAKDIVEYQLINNSKYIYALYLDRKNILKNFKNVEYFIELQPSYIIYNENDSIEIIRGGNELPTKKIYKKYFLFWEEKETRDSTYLAKNKYKYKNYSNKWALTNKYYEDNEIILLPGDTIKLKSPVRINQEREIYNLVLTYYPLNKDKKYKFQQIIKSDSNKIKEYLLPEKLDSLKINNIKIFHGVLKSNKIPIKVNSRNLYKTD